jgi:DNA-binding IclR family transcriptional regulator
VAAAIKGTRSTVHRYMTTLVALGQLEQIAGRKYKRVAA